MPHRRTRAPAPTNLTQFPITLPAKRRPNLPPPAQIRATPFIYSLAPGYSSCAGPLGSQGESLLTRRLYQSTIYYFLPLESSHQQPKKPELAARSHKLYIRAGEVFLIDSRYPQEAYHA